MTGKESPRILSILALTAAALLLVLYVGLQYGTFEQLPGRIPMTSSPLRGPASALGQKRLTSEGRADLSTGQIYNAASPSVALIEVFDDEGHKRGLGSGFLASNGGAILTNYHVIRGAYSAVAKFQSGGSASVLGVVGYDRHHDVALVTIASAIAPPLRLGDARHLKVGDKLIAIGSPKGLQNTVSEGIVSAIRGGLIQMTTPISSGSSGGPVIDAQGNVVGIAMSLVRDAENLNFAVPIEWAKTYIGASPSKSLAELAHENTVVENIVDGRFSVAAGAQRTWKITLNRNQMSNPVLYGAFQSSGGLDGLIRVAVSCDQQPIYDSNRVTYGPLHVDLPGDGECQLSIDNTAASTFARTVTSTIALRYVR